MSRVEGFQCVCCQSLSTRLGVKVFNASDGVKGTWLSTRLGSKAANASWGKPCSGSETREGETSCTASVCFADTILPTKRPEPAQHKHHLTPDNHFCLSAPQRKLFKQTPSLASPTTLRAKPSAQVTFPPPRPTHAWGSERGQHPHHLTVSQN